MKTLVAILALLVAALFGVMTLSDSRADIAQAQAAIEAARAAQDAAKAAQIASAGQAAMGIGMTFILILLALSFVAILGLAIYIVVLRMQSQKKQWAPGPNAQFKRLEEKPAIPSGMDGLIQIAMLNYLQQMAPQRPAPRLPALREDEWEK